MMLGIHPHETHHQSRKRRIFQSVFPPATSASIPTPVATPNTSFSANTPVSTGTQTSPFFRSQPFSQSDAFVTTNRAWHLATTFLSFQEAPFDVAEEEGSVLGIHREGLYLRRKTEIFSRDIKEAIGYLMVPEVVKQGESLIEWYGCEVRRHFLDHIKPSLDECDRKSSTRARPEQILNRILAQLRVATRIYISLFRIYLLPHQQAQGLTNSLEPFRRSLTSIISYSLPSIFPSLLSRTLHAYFAIILSLPGASTAVSDVGLFTSPHIPDPDETVHSNDLDLELEEDEKAVVDQEEATRRRDESRHALYKLVEGLNSIGLMANSVGEREFATVVDLITIEWIVYRFSGRFSSDDLVEEEEDADGDTSMAHPRHIGTDVIIHEWLSDQLMPLVTSVLRISHPADLDDELPPFVTNLKHRLSLLRMSELFDIIVDFPESMPGIFDLLPSLNTPNARLLLTNTFTHAINARLLHQGAGTVDILRAYISMIKAFKIIDSKGVLLDRVGGRVRKYLNSREDTVVELVRGILSYGPEEDDDDIDSNMAGSSASPEMHESNVMSPAVTNVTDLIDAELSENSKDVHEPENVLRELNTELQSCAQFLGESKREAMGPAAAAGLEELDFDDPNWVPDPIDAGPEFRKSQGTDIVSHLLSINTHEKFIQEFQSQLAARLLMKSTSEFLREKETIELLKVRFSEEQMRNCMVMVKDLTESKKIDNHVQDSFDRSKSVEHSPDVHAKIISGLFWPSEMISGETFKVPDQVGSHLSKFDQGYESLKKSRKLNWLQDQGYTSVHLELSDRTLQFQHVPTYAAAVIDTFAAVAPNGKSSITGNRINGGEVGNAWSVNQLEEHLSMSEELVAKSLEYWMDKKVLGELPTDTDIYYVMETLPQRDIPASRRETPYNTPRKAKKILPHSKRRRALSFISNSSAESLETEDEQKDKRSPIKSSLPKQGAIPPAFKVAWNFIESMLTNQGRTSTDRLFGTLSMVMIPVGGISFDFDELEAFLRQMEDQGKVERVPEGWKIATSK